VEVDASTVKKIKINSCSVEELKHPYLKWNQVNGIVNYRQKHGKFKTIDEIKNTDLVDDETLRKLAPYLQLE
jgi:competence protein ComEA